MAKLIYRIENSLESKDSGPVADILAAVAFLFALGSCLTWLSL